VKEVSDGAGTKKYYAFNPQILQSPIKDSTTYIKHDGSSFTIPLETVEGFLEWLALGQSVTSNTMSGEYPRHNERDRSIPLFFGPVDYVSFLDFIGVNARQWDFKRKSTNPRPALHDLIMDYMCEIGKLSPKYSRRIQHTRMISIFKNRGKSV